MGAGWGGATSEWRAAPRGSRSLASHPPPPAPTSVPHSLSLSGLRLTNDQRKMEETGCRINISAFHLRKWWLLNVQNRFGNF